MQRQGITYQNLTKDSKGFTLIELLVVIAIIGILVAIILASLSSSRLKSADAGIQSELLHARNQIELYYAANGNYGTALFTAGQCNATTTGTVFKNDTKVQAILNNAGYISNGTDLTRGNCVLTGTSIATSWAISMPLKTNSIYFWCVDSIGASRQVQPSGGDLGFSGGACK
ncbi:MAG: type II secretion system protein [Candidatus Pacebacteria bacterium]|nr:type II secretion system protein [Candidatus Paceibacterota bacterium]